MRTARMKVPEGMDGLYHVVSRVVDRRMVFGEEEKKHFLGLMRAYAGFSGLQVIAWCVMGNHFRLLVRVPAPGKEPASEEEVLRRMGLIYKDGWMRIFREQFEKSGSRESREALLRPFRRRMGDLGLFMKTLKQRFTQWFNRRHERKGTLWEDRYRSVIVEVGDDHGEAGQAARIVAAYIDLNPLRAGLVDDPKDYPWCGYAAALLGDEDALAGLRYLWGNVGPPEGPAILAAHRLFLFDEGSAERQPEAQKGGVQAPGTAQTKNRRAIDPRKVWQERKRGGRLPLWVVLRLRVKYFTAGGILGSPAFIEKIAGHAGIPGKRGVGMKFADWHGLHSLRNLRVDVIG